MKKNIFLHVVFLLSLISFISYGTTLEAVGNILKTCSIDLNKDGKSDRATLYEKKGQRSIELLLSSERETYVYEIVKAGEGKADLTMNCKKGYEVNQGKSVSEKEEKIKIPNGAYLEVIFPESGSFISYYKERALQKVWTSD